MSKISLSGDVSGTGTITIAAPNTNTSRTLNLPDASGTIFTDGSTLGVSQLPAQLSVSGSAAAGSVAVDASGRVRMPYQPCFYLRSAARTGAADATITITSGTVYANVGSHYNTANGRFTAPIDGIYCFTFWVTRSNQTLSTFQFDIHLNGVTTSRSLCYTTAYQSSSVTAVLTMSAGDYATAVVIGSNGGTPDIYGAGFSGFLLA